MKKLILLSLLVWSAHYGLYSQTAEIDSLETLIQQAPDDTSKLKNLVPLISKVRRVDLNRGMALVEKGLTLSQEIGNDEYTCRIGLEKAMILLNSGKTDLALEKSLEMGSLCEKVDLLNKSGTAYFLASNVSLSKGNPKDAMKYAQLSIKKSREGDYTYGQVLGLKALGDIAEGQGDYVKALAHYQEGMVISKENNFGSQIMVLNNNLGITYDMMGMNDKALGHYIEAEEYADKNGERDGQISFLANIADILGMQGEYQKAYDISMKALEIVSQTNNKREVPGLLSQLGKLSGQLGDTDKELDYYQQARALSEELNNQRALSFSLDNLANYYLRYGPKSKAEPLFLESLRIREAIDFKPGISKSYNNLAEYYEAENQPNRAIRYYSQAEQIAKEMNYQEELRNSYSGLARMHADRQNYKEAYAYQSQYLIVKDSIWNENRNAEIARMEVQFDIKQKENEIADLEEDRRILQESRKKDLRIRQLLIASALLLGLLLFSVIWWARSIKKKNSIIEESRRQVSQSLLEKETLLKEIHHRVKNNLQIVSSLLNLQTRHATDDQTISTIREGQSRVQAMSLIHNQLYQSEKLHMIDMQDYLSRLIQNINTMFHEHRISTEVDAEGVEFDIDTAMPLGLIINELVTNSYKYAFAKGEEGLIKIKIDEMENGSYQLMVSDNGKGFDHGTKESKSNSLGLRLVSILTKQLNGEVNNMNKDGATVLIDFAPAQMAA